MLKATFSFPSQAIRASVAGSRRLHVSPVAQKTLTEKVGEVADKVNKGLGKGLASAIDKGEEVTKSAKDTINTTTTQAKQKANEGEANLKQKGEKAAAQVDKAKDNIRKEL